MRMESHFKIGKKNKHSKLNLEKKQKLPTEQRGLSIEYVYYAIIQTKQFVQKILKFQLNRLYL